jgi:hypothetical protein
MAVFSCYRTGKVSCKVTGQTVVSDTTDLGDLVVLAPCTGAGWGAHGTET